MDHLGRHRLPHEIPPWVSDPEKETFFLTLCVQNRHDAPLLRHDRPAKILEAIRFYHAQEKWWIHLALVMPDHLHLIAYFPGDMPTTVQKWKHWTARNLNIDWQRDFFDHRLRRDESFAEKSDYILQNPVRAGLVKTPEEWPHLWLSPR
jgi:putative transposase